MIAPRIIEPPDNNGVRTIVSEENCPPGNCLPDNCPMDDCPPDHFPQTIASEENCALPARIIAPRTISPEDNCPRGTLLPAWLPPDYCSRKITPRVIAPWQYPTGNCPRGKLPFGWFVVYIIAPRKTVPQEYCSTDKLQPIFSPRIRNRSTLIDSWFLLFSVFVV